MQWSWSSRMWDISNITYIFNFFLLVDGAPGYANHPDYMTQGGPPGAPGQMYPGGMYGGVQQYDSATLGRNPGTGTYNANFNTYGGASAGYGPGQQYGWETLSFM